MKDEKKNFGYYGTAVFIITVGLLLFVEFANNIESSFGFYPCLIFTTVVAAVIVYSNRNTL